MLDVSEATAPMLVDCPNCARSYHVGATELGTSGRMLVCPRCHTSWHQPAETRALEIPAVSGRPTFALDETPAPARRWRLPRRMVTSLGAAVGGLALLAIPVAAYADRDAVVRAMPRTAALYAAAGVSVNVFGLQIEGVTPERAASNDVTIRGALRNVAGHRVGVPRLTFEVRDADDHPLVAWSETVATKPLPAGRRLAFASSPHRLPPESRTVTVRMD